MIRDEDIHANRTYFHTGLNMNTCTDAYEEPPQVRKHHPSPKISSLPPVLSPFLLLSLFFPLLHTLSLSLFLSHALSISRTLFSLALFSFSFARSLSLHPTFSFPLTLSLSHCKGTAYSPHSWLVGLFQILRAQRGRARPNVSRRHNGPALPWRERQTCMGLLCRKTRCRPTHTHH